MEFKTFFKTQIAPGFFISVACISLAMGVIGTAFLPDVSLGYGILFSPLIYGLMGAVLQLVNYSKKELTLRQIILRKVLHVLLLEIGIAAILYAGKAFTGIEITIALLLSILVIYFAVTLVMWINDKRISETVNAALKELQKRTTGSE